VHRSPARCASRCMRRTEGRSRPQNRSQPSLLSSGNPVFGGGWRITPRLRRSTLRAAATFLPLRGCAGPSVGSPSSPPALGGKVCCWWRGEDSNLRRLSRQIYSLIPLTAREPLQKRGGILWEGDITVNCVRLVAALTAKNTATPVVASRRLRQQRPRLHPTRAVCGGLIDDNPLRTLEKS
jgi:hypothetical protein